MPLPGGPSDKLGNRYELRWIVRRMIDIITGRIEWIRVEPPGEDAIEFRCRTDLGEEAHQVKRGLSGGGHWTISALGEVLDGFGSLLASERELTCAFVSEHAAAELKELTERSRDARDLTEFLARFLNAKSVLKGWKQIQKRWSTNDEETWLRLRRITVTSVSEQHLQENTDVILQLLFDAPAATARAVLTDLALEAVHQELRRQQILTRLSDRGIRRFQSSETTNLIQTMTAPPTIGIRRTAELKQLADLLTTGVSTIFLGGITGIGKTTVASQFAAEWQGPVCWVDCGLITSEPEAIGCIGEFLASTLEDSSVNLATAKGDTRSESVSKLAGKRLASHGCLLVWDGLDGDIERRIRPTIDAISVTIPGGAQIITAQEQQHGAGRTSASSRVHVDRLDKAAVRRLLVDAYPEARVSDLEAADDLTQGHPYLVQLLTGAAQNVDLQTALHSLLTTDGSESIVSQVLAHIPPGSLAILTTLAWLGIHFPTAHISRLGGTNESIVDLARRHLILRSGANTYRVHDIIANLIKRRTSEAEALELHQRAALFLRGLDKPAWLEVRAMLIHARASAMSDIAREAGESLLEYATQAGQWVLAREAAESLILDSIGVEDWFPHFILGKCTRITGELEAALEHFENAEVLSVHPREQEMARYERASVLCGLGRRTEANPLYEELAGSSNPAVRVESLIAIAFGMSRSGDFDSAVATLEKAAPIAREAGLIREEAEVWQGMGVLLSSEERWEEARHCLKKAYAMRYSLGGAEGKDVYGWYHLLESAFEVERALDNHHGAWGAARSLWNFALISGSIDWEINAAHAVCSTAPSANEPEVVAAVTRLRGIGEDSTRLPDFRLSALNALVLCEWSSLRYRQAIEAILEILAISVENDLETSSIGHILHNKDARQNVFAVPGGHFLMLPPGEDLNFITVTVSSILERRPELAKYAIAHMFGRPSSDPPKS